MQQAIDILDRLEDKVRKQQAMTNYTEWVQNWAIHYLREAGKEIQALWDGWIPVTERLPPTDNSVLCFGDYIFIGLYSHIPWIPWAHFQIQHTWETKRANLWMPLPNSPKQ